MRRFCLLVAIHLKLLLPTALIVVSKTKINVLDDNFSKANKNPTLSPSEYKKVLNKSNQTKYQIEYAFHPKALPNLISKFTEAKKWPIDYLKPVWICSQLWPSIDTCPVKKSLLCTLNGLHGNINWQAIKTSGLEKCHVELWLDKADEFKFCGKLG